MKDPVSDDCAQIMNLGAIEFRHPFGELISKENFLKLFFILCPCKREH
jgi:hypothetical protein